MNEVNTIKRVYGYVRLSRDEDKEQNSLNNQKQIILEYAKTKGYNVIKIFEDDNISGMTFDRDGINELKDVVNEGLVDILLVKDLSRIGRHKSYSALFLEYLRTEGVMAISITEGLDNFNDNDDLVIGFKQIINEQYAKDISKKIRASFKQKQKEGLVIVPPFGYMKNPTTKKLEINFECSEIVKNIYSLYIEGYGSKKIAANLTERGIHTPSWYQKQKSGKIYQPGKQWTGGIVWSDRTVLRILENDAYIGTLRCGVSTRSIIHKYKKEIPKEEHIIHENFYPPIIDIDIWTTAQAIKKNRCENNVRASSNTKIHRYAGLLTCADCGASFVAKKRIYKGEEYIEYVCNGYHRFGNSVCSPHRIKETELDEEIYSFLNRLKTTAKNNLESVDKFLQEWNSKKKDYNKTIDKIEYQIFDLKNEIKQYAKQLAKQLIVEDMFKELTQESNEQILILEKQMETLKEIKEINNDVKLGIRRSVDILNEISDQKQMSNADLQVLINKIQLSLDKNTKLNFYIDVNTVFSQHLTLSNVFTEATALCVNDYSVIELINYFSTYYKSYKKAS